MGHRGGRWLHSTVPRKVKLARSRAFTQWSYQAGDVYDGCTPRVIGTTSRENLTLEQSKGGNQIPRGNEELAEQIIPKLPGRSGGGREAERSLSWQESRTFTRLNSSNLKLRKIPGGLRQIHTGPPWGPCLPRGHALQHGGDASPERRLRPPATQPHRSRSKQGCVAVATVTSGAGVHHARERDHLHPRQHNLASLGRNRVVLTC